MTSSLIQVLKDIVTKEINSKDIVVDSKELVISKEKKTIVVNLGKLTS